ncbi:MAG: hypothetical protein LPK21_17770, partial [Hymenobacteraceae bacterium]|nr:hypothetical protein [Hymenobacteraceae bacterium]
MFLLLGVSLNFLPRLPLCAQTPAVVPLAVACPSDSVELVSVNFKGNKKTKESILRVELDIKEGEKFDSATFFQKVEENRLRLFNLQLFHWVKPVLNCTDGRAELVYEVQERWYLFPVPIFSLADRNFSAWLDKMDFRRIDYGLHLVQYNMRGRNETFKTNLQYGFNRKYELFYTFPYISRRQKLGLSLGGSVYQSHF